MECLKKLLAKSKSLSDLWLNTVIGTLDAIFPPKRPLKHYDNYKVTIETPSDEFLEFVFKYEADRLHEIASFYKTKNLKKADPSVLTEGKQILEEKCRRLQNAAIDYAFSSHEDSHPDYEKALVYGNIALNEIENALAYQERGFE